ncbi:hypothetical protein RJT34_02386 [Clitoria ternatea]|uniref:Rab3-GAP regulatory subunit N-terminal domain-containing protein n=1 Tax=Clitoria ternatea TaxID=43366 RepID=A0AAN9Q1N6_CLITE
MARRSYKTVLGCVACEELGELGAGNPGWLVDNPNLLCAIDTHSLLLANRSTLLLFSWSLPTRSPLKIRPELSPIESESISAVEWLVFDDVRVIVAATSCGYLLFYSLNGELIHRQMIYPAQVLKLRVRGTKKDLIQDASSEEFCLVMPGVIARLDGSDIQNMLQKWFEEAHSRFWDQKPKTQDSENMGDCDIKLPCQLWNIGKYGTCADAAITGIMPPPLMEQQSSQRYYCAVAVGEDAVISAYRLSEDKGKSLVEAILSKVVPATFSTIASFSKLIWRSEQTSQKKSPKKSDQKPLSFAKASPLTCLKDHPRKGEKLTLSPSGTLAAITDSLGRILLLDTLALVVVRLWKGYRDASCLFMEMLVKKDIASSSSTYSEPMKSDYCLCLAIHAPRKGIIEIWQMRTGPRLRTIPCAKGSKMLQPTYRFGASMSSPYVPLEVFVLNGDSGQISVLNRTLDS